MKKRKKLKDGAMEELRVHRVKCKLLGIRMF